MVSEDMLQEMRSWVKLMETGYISNNGAALSPVDSYNLLRLLEEALNCIEDIRRRYPE